MCFAPQRRALFRHLSLQKWSENGFVHFDFKMCFAPQRRALFRHLNCQKWSGPGVFCAFWLGNVLRATTACAFLTSQLPKVVRDRQFFTLLTSKCASRHNGVQFFIAPVASWLRTRRFSEPTFRPSGATNHWKNTVFRDFPTFSRICIFCLLTLSLLIFSLLIFLFSLPLPYSAFHLSILSEVWLLNFLRLYDTGCIFSEILKKNDIPKLGKKTWTAKSRLAVSETRFWPCQIKDSSLRNVPHRSFYLESFETWLSNDSPNWIWCESGVQWPISRISSFRFRFW